MSVFLLLVVTILLVVNAVVCATWAYFFSLPDWWLWQIWPASLALLFVITTIAGYRFAHPVLRALYAVSAVWLGILNYLFFAALVCWIAAVISMVLGVPLPRVPLGWAGLLMGLGAAAVGGWNGSLIRITRFEVALPNLPPSWHGRNPQQGQTPSRRGIFNPGGLANRQVEARAGIPEEPVLPGRDGHL